MIKPILIYPNRILSTQSSRFDYISKNVDEGLFQDLKDTCIAAKGVGLAACQIGINLRIAVIDPSKDQYHQGKEPFIAIDPIVMEQANPVVVAEGCLSLPGENHLCKRYANILVSYFDKDLQKQTMECSGLLAQCFQHEIDHMDGKVYINQLSLMRQDMITKKMKKLMKRINLEGWTPNEK